MLRHRYIKRKKTILILIILLLILGGAFFSYKTFKENKLNRFEVTVDNLNCTNQNEISNYLKGRNLNYFNFKAKEIEDGLQKKFFCIGKIEQEISYPDKLKLRVSGREGKFVVTSIETNTNPNPQIILSLDQMNATQSTTEAFPPKILNEVLRNYKEASPSSMFLVDEDGMVFEEVSSDVMFPRLVIFSADLQIGRVIPDEVVKKTSLILEKISQTEIVTDNLIVVNDRLIIESKPRVIFSLNRDLDKQAASLQLILTQAKMNLDPGKPDSRSVESVDLRFDRPVVIYGKN